MNNHRILQQVLEDLVHRYRQRVPDVGKILNALVEEQVIPNPDAIENDHIAFRTLGVPHLGIGSLEKIFLHYGYTRMDYYHFTEKKLDAWWYAPPSVNFPRIFLSELRVPELSAEAQAIIYRYTTPVIADPVDAINLDDAAAVDDFLHRGLWALPTLPDYEALLSESEYAAWVIFNRYYLNHYTIAVHELKTGYHTVPLFNEFLERHGVVLNDAGGKVKQSPDDLLLQSSTVAGRVAAIFAGGVTQMIPGSYVEFAERRVLPAFRDLPPSAIKREHRREGFEALNANKIFESTFSSQVK